MMHNQMLPRGGQGDAKAPRKSLWFYLLPLATLLLIFALGWLVTEKKKEVAAEQAQGGVKERAAVNVVVMETALSTIKDRLDLPGVIEPWLDLELLAKIRGEVVEVRVREGAQVAQDELLALIDDADYRIAATAAEAAHKQASADLKRTQALFAKGLTSEAELEDSKTRAKIASANLENAALQLSRCRVTAPVAGVIQRLDIKKGSILNAADPLARILQINQVKAVVGIPESDVDAVRALGQAQLTIQALANRRILGQRHFLASAPDTMARLYRLELAVDNADLAILPGMFVRAELIKQEAQGIAVPLYAVISRNNDKFIYVEEKGTARRRDVRLGILQEWMVQVVEGVQSGERIIVEGHRNVEDGQKVNVAQVLTGAQGSLP